MPRHDDPSGSRPMPLSLFGVSRQALFGVALRWAPVIAVGAASLFFDLGFAGKVDKIHLIVSSRTSQRTDPIRQVDRSGPRGTGLRRGGASVMNGSKVIEPGTGRSSVLGAIPEE
jgi:hypothetical protein